VGVHSVSFVIAASGVEANKYATHGSGYNMRVVECRLAAVLLGKALGIENWTQIRYGHTGHPVKEGLRGSPLHQGPLLSSLID
jgi:galactokinase